MDKITDEILLDYIDGLLPEKEVEQIDAVLEKDTQLRLRIKELKFTDNVLTGSLDNPSNNFTDLVWGRIAGNSSSKKFSINSLVIVIAAMLTVVLGSYFITDSMMELNVNWRFENIGGYLTIPEELNIKEGINLKLISQILLYATSFLILLLLDRIVLRPYFQKRREMISGI